MAAKKAAPKKPRVKKEPAPHAELHQDYVRAALRGMWGRDTNLAAIEAMHAARLSKAIREGKMPLPDGSMPSPADVEQIIASMRHYPLRPFTLGLVDGRWQRYVEEASTPAAPVSRTFTARRRPLTADDLR